MDQIYRFTQQPNAIFFSESSPPFSCCFIFPLLFLSSARNGPHPPLQLGIRPNRGHIAGVWVHIKPGTKRYITPFWALLVVVCCPQVPGSRDRRPRVPESAVRVLPHLQAEPPAGRVGPSLPDWRREVRRHQCMGLCFVLLALNPTRLAVQANRRIRPPGF